MKPLTVSQSAEIATFAKTYAEERFGLTVEVTISRAADASDPVVGNDNMFLAFGRFVLFLVAPFAGISEERDPAVQRESGARFRTSRRR
jgi:hypothetical protein